MAQYIDKSALVSEIKERIETYKKGYANGDDRRADALEVLLHDIDTLEVKEAKEEPVSEDLEEAASRYAKEEYSHKSPATLPDRCRGCYAPLMYAFKTGAKWQKANLWKDAQGDELPEIDREVIALVQDYSDDAEHLRIVYAHRPPEYWDGKNILTGEVTCYKPKRYDKGGWNLPNVKYWLDVEFPKVEDKP